MWNLFNLLSWCSTAVARLHLSSFWSNVRLINVSSSYTAVFTESQKRRITKSSSGSGWKGTFGDQLVQPSYPSTLLRIVSEWLLNIFWKGDCEISGQPVLVPRRYSAQTFSGDFAVTLLYCAWNAGVRAGDTTIFKESINVTVLVCFLSLKKCINSNWR